MNKKKIIYFLIELLFLALNVMFVLFIHSRYFPNNHYDIYGFLMLLIILVSTMLTFGPLFNKIICGILLSFYYLYLSGQFNHFNSYQTYYHYSLSNIFTYGSKTFLIIIWMIVIVFIALYFLFQKGIFNQKKLIKYRILAPALIPLCFLIKNNNDKEIAKPRYLNAYNVNETEYYNYLHIENEKEFVDSYGIFNYFIKDYAQKDLNSKKTDDEIKEFLNTFPSHTNNEYTGIFKDKNVIFIQMNDMGLEYFNHEALSPNIYNSFHHSLAISNFMTSKLYYNSNDTEFMANLSLVPDSNIDLACYKYDNNFYPTTLASIYKNAGYSTNFFINDYAIYYNREKMVAAYGYDEFFYSSRIGDNEISDLDYIDRISNIIAEADYKFMGYYILQPNEEFLNDEVINKIKEVIPDAKEEDYQYYANGIYYDQIIEVLINKLKNANKLNDTVVVMFGDGGTFKKTGTELCFFNQDYIGHYRKQTSVIDLLPSCANLWDIPYNSQEIIGRDLFDDNYYGVTFSFDRSESEYWTSIAGVYDYYLHNAFAFDGYDQEKVEELFRDFSKRLDISLKILKSDYFRHN